MLCPQVNIIPVIAKADTISKSELHKFKIKIMSELVSNGVQIYQFPTDDETVAKINTAMNVSHGRLESCQGRENEGGVVGVQMSFVDLCFRVIFLSLWLAAQRR